MKFPFYIARRYLFSKKSHNAINIISMISVCGVVVATIALVCVLSVFNGFDDLVSGMFSHFDPQLKITPKAGKVFDPRTAQWEQVKSLPEIEFFGEVLQDNALVIYRERQDIGVVVKGVDDQYHNLTGIDNLVIDGEFTLREDVVDYATLGVGLAYKLGIQAGFVSPLQIYAPKRNEAVNTVNPATSLNMEYAYITAVFRVDQQEYDEKYMIVPLELARQLFRYEHEVSAIELKLTDRAKLKAVRNEIRSILGDDFNIEDRYEQQKAAFKMMQIEKWMTYLILSFILSIALFNIVGSLSMLMIDKQEDVRTLRTMGANDHMIRRIFLFEGWMISGFGALIGIVIGLVLCLLQQEFGLIRLGNAPGEFVINAYPVRVDIRDIGVVFLTVASIGLLACWYPVRYLGRKWLQTKK